MAASAGNEEAKRRASGHAKRWWVGPVGMAASGGLVAGAAALPLPFWAGLALGVGMMIPLTVMAVAMAIRIVHHTSPGATVSEAAAAIAVVIFALLPFGPRFDPGLSDPRPDKGNRGS